MEDYEENASTNTSTLSKINSAAIVNATLNNLWQDFFRHLRHGEFLNANNDLDCIWTILGGEKGVKEKRGKDKTVSKEMEYLTIQQTLNKVSPLFNAVPSSGFKSNPIFIGILNKQKKVILNKSLFLRKLQNIQGKGTAYEDEDEAEFE